jgi:hypothetical protein
MKPNVNSETERWHAGSVKCMNISFPTSCSGVSQSHASISRVFPKFFVLLVGNGEFRMTFLSGDYERHESSSWVCDSRNSMIRCVSNSQKASRHCGTLSTPDTETLINRRGLRCWNAFLEVGCGSRDVRKALPIIILEAGYQTTHTADVGMSKACS